MKIVFAGTPDFAATALATIHDAGFEIVLVLTQPDRPAGRGMQLQASSVKQFALAHGIPVAQPVSLRLDGKYPADAEAAHALLRTTPHDVMVVAAYGLILPPSVLAIPPRGCLNIHGSLLPRWRGAAPIHRAIEAGDTQTGITIMQMDAGLDTGPMLSMQALPISPEDTTGSMHDELACLGGVMIVEALREMDEQPGPVAGTVQTEVGATYAPKIRKDEALLDFLQPASLVARKIRAFNPFPGAIAHFGDVTLKLWHAQEAGPSQVQRGAAAAGTVLAADPEEGILIACGQDATGGMVRVTELQKPGGKRLGARDFLQGFALAGGRFL
ncbi:MAG: methionyl-tRNA formyltransferase [Herminiimonas sp.]|nr:methionyl-tRNA formyltransferase [Herminiimonas sp.]